MPFLYYSLLWRSKQGQLSWLTISAAEGALSKSGYGSDADKESLRDAINAAKNVASNANASQGDIDKALKDLKDATASYNAKNGQYWPDGMPNPYNTQGATADSTASNFAPGQDVRDSTYRPWESANSSPYPFEGNTTQSGLNLTDTIDPYIPHGENNTGDRGSGFKLPSWDYPIELPFSTGDLNIPSSLLPDISKMNPNYPLPDMSAYAGYSWPPVIQPGSAPVTSGTLENREGFDWIAWLKNYSATHQERV